MVYSTPTGVLPEGKGTPPPTQGPQKQWRITTEPGLNGHIQE